MLAQARQTPWKAINELRRYAELPLIRAYFALHGVAWGQGWMIYGRPLIQRHAGSTITIGRGLNLRNWFGSNPLGVNHRSILATWAADAAISLGDDVGMTGATIVAQTAVQHWSSRLRRREQHHLRYRFPSPARRSASG